LHRACNSVQTRLNRGERKRKAFRRVAKYHNGRAFKCDPRRRLSLSEGTLRRLFAKWKRVGEVPSAFWIQYKPRRSTITAPVLIRFIDFSARQQFPSMKSAWEKFSARGGNFGCGRRSNKPVKISYGMARYYFPAAKFHKLQEQLEKIDQAQDTLAWLRLDFQAEIITLLPERPPRRRVKKESDFQI
jgi:hypothetical protein